MKSSAAKKMFQEVHAEHILVESREAAHKILNKIENQEITFEEAATQYSQCSSRTNGGDLGYFRRGMMVKEFEDAAFAINIGQISAPIQTQFGWHLIKILDKR